MSKKLLFNTISNILPPVDPDVPLEKTWIEWGCSSGGSIQPFYVEYNTPQELKNGQVLMQMKFTLGLKASIRPRMLLNDEGDTAGVSLGVNGVAGKTYIMRAKYINSEFQLWLQVDDGPDEYKVSTTAITNNFLGVAQQSQLKSLYFWSSQQVYKNS